MGIKSHNINKQVLESKWLYKELTEKIIGAAIEVHKVLGCGFLEGVYQESLCYELDVRKITYRAQKELSIWYKDRQLSKKCSPDLIIEDKVILELKATNGLTDIDEAQLLNYLKASKIRIGLLFNFGAKSLQIKRKIK